MKGAWWISLTLSTRSWLLSAVESGAVRCRSREIGQQDFSNELRPGDDAIELGAPALERRAHLAHRGMDLVGPDEPWWPVSEDGLDDGDVSAHLGEPGRDRAPDVM